MIDDITSVVNGVLSSIGSLIDPGTASLTAAYVAILALPILGGTVAFARRLIKKSR